MKKNFNALTFLRGTCSILALSCSLYGAEAMPEQSDSDSAAARQYQEESSGEGTAETPTYYQQPAEWQYKEESSGAGTAETPTYYQQPAEWQYQEEREKDDKEGDLSEEEIAGIAVGGTAALAAIGAGAIGAGVAAKRAYGRAQKRKRQEEQVKRQEEQIKGWKKILAGDDKLSRNERERLEQVAEEAIRAGKKPNEVTDIMRVALNPEEARALEAAKRADAEKAKKDAARIGLRTGERVSEQEAVPEKEAPAPSPRGVLIKKAEFGGTSFGKLTPEEEGFVEAIKAKQATAGIKVQTKTFKGSTPTEISERIAKGPKTLMPLKREFVEAREERELGETPKFERPSAMLKKSVSKKIEPQKTVPHKTGFGSAPKKIGMSTSETEKKKVVSLKTPPKLMLPQPMKTQGSMRGIKRY